MNVISISGRVGQAETRQTSSGDTVLNFSVADDQGKDKPAIWWRCSLMGKRADSLSPYIVKGASVTVVGNVKEREYTDKDGNQKKSTEVRVSDIALQGGRQEQSAPAQRPAKPPAKPPTGFEDMDDDLPF